MQKINFRNCDLDQLDEWFGLQQVRPLLALDGWLAMEGAISEFEREMLIFFQNNLIENQYNWNEQELALNFIGPVMSMAQFSTPYYNAFNERTIAATINDIEMSGKVDGMIAAGRRNPKKPFFAYKNTIFRLRSIQEKKKI